jgi:hypothetical protein
MMAMTRTCRYGSDVYSKVGSTSTHFSLAWCWLKLTSEMIGSLSVLFLQHHVLMQGDRPRLDLTIHDLAVALSLPFALLAEETPSF